jgi:hypothetical protein
LIYESERNHTELVVKGFEFGAGERNKNWFLILLVKDFFIAW